MCRCSKSAVLAYADSHLIGCNRMWVLARIHGSPKIRDTNSKQTCRFADCTAPSPLRYNVQDNVRVVHQQAHPRCIPNARGLWMKWCCWMLAQVNLPGTKSPSNRDQGLEKEQGALLQLSQFTRCPLSTSKHTALVTQWAWLVGQLSSIFAAKPMKSCCRPCLTRRTCDGGYNLPLALKLEQLAPCG